MAISAFSNFTIMVSDGGTIPSLDYMSTKTYVDIGSGNILKISWETPVATNNIVDSYKVNIVLYDTASAQFITLYNNNIGNVNDFYLKSSVLASRLQQSFFVLNISVEALSKYGSAYNGVSNIVPVNISRGCGTYIKVLSGYAQPIMKRAIAFTKLDYASLIAAGATPLLDADGKAIYGKISNVQDAASGWTLMQEFYSKDSANTWKTNDILYEVLTDTSGEIVIDTNNDPIYVL